MVVSAFALFSFAFAFIFVSSFVSISGGERPPFVQVPPCPEGTHRFWRDRCILFVEKCDDDDEVNKRLDQDDAKDVCEIQAIGIGYSWDLPELRFIGKQQALHQLLRSQRDIEKIKGIEQIKGEWYFWNRLLRELRGSDWMSELKKEMEEVETAHEFPTWVDETDDDDGYRADLQDQHVCIISKERSNGTYPWFEWIKAPCELDHGNNTKTKRIEATMKSNGIVVCEGTHNPSSVISKPTPSPEITASVNPKEPTTTSIVSSTSQNETTPISIANSLSTSPASIAQSLSTSPTSSSTPISPNVSFPGTKTTTPKPIESTTSGSAETSPWQWVAVGLICVSTITITTMGIVICVMRRRATNLRSRIKSRRTTTTTTSSIVHTSSGSTDDSYEQEMGRIPKRKGMKKRHTK